MSSTCIHLVCSLYQLDTAAYLCTVTTACFMVNCWRAMEWHEDAVRRTLPAHAQCTAAGGTEWSEG